MANRSLIYMAQRARPQLFPLILLVSALAGPAAADPPAESDRLQQALYSEQILGSIDTALAAYRPLMASKRPRIAARARLGVGRCLQAKGEHREALAALHAVLRLHSDQLDVVQQALEMINAYKTEAERALALSSELLRVRAEKDALEKRLAAAARQAGGADDLRRKLTETQGRLRVLEQEQARRGADAHKLMIDLSRREAERLRIASELAEHFLDAASAQSREGRLADALRFLLLARKNAPGDPRIDSRINAILPSLGEEEREQLTELRREIDELQERLEQQLARGRARLRSIAELADREPLQALVALRTFLRELPESLAASRLAAKARDQLLDLMRWSADRPAARLGEPEQLPGTDERLARYPLPDQLRRRDLPGGGFRSLSLDRELLVSSSTPFLAPTLEERRRALHRELAALVGLEQPRSPAFAVVAGSTLVVIGPEETHRELAALVRQIHRGFDQLHDIQLQLIQLPASDRRDRAPWADLLVDARPAGDGAIQPLDATGTATLLRTLSATTRARQRSVGPLRLWGTRPGKLTVEGTDVFLVGYTRELVGGTLVTREVPHLLPSGMSLSVSARAVAGGTRLTLGFDSTRVRRPVPIVQTRLGPIQLPSRARQLVRTSALVPTGGSLLLFGLTDPVPLDANRPGQLALLVRPTAPSAKPGTPPARRLPLGALAAIPDPPAEDLGGRSPLPDRLELLRADLAAAAPRVEVVLAEGSLVAQGPSASVAAVERRLEALRDHVKTRVRLRIHAWSVPRSLDADLAKALGRKDLPRGLAALILDDARGRAIYAAMPKDKRIRRMPLPVGPYVARGTERIVASRIVGTRYLRHPGPPPQYARVNEGIVLSLTSLPGEVFDFRCQLGHLRQLRGTLDGAARPQRSLVSGNLSMTLPVGRWAVVSGLRDPADSKRRAVLLIERLDP